MESYQEFIDRSYVNYVDLIVFVWKTKADKEAYNDKLEKWDFETYENYLRYLKVLN